MTVLTALTIFISVLSVVISLAALARDKRRLALLALPAALLIGTACGPPTSAGALLQRTACNSTVQPPNGSACVHWVNHQPAWQYPAETEWVGPYTDFLFDVSHGNGAELDAVSGPSFDDTLDYWVSNPDETDNVCPDCGFDSDHEVEYANHRRDQHFKNALVFPDQAAYDVWLEGNAA